jgi:hypothetical protein
MRTDSFHLEQGGDQSRFFIRIVVPADGNSLGRLQFVIGRSQECITLPIESPVHAERERCLAA